MQAVEHERFLPRGDHEPRYFRIQLGLAQWDSDDRSIGYAWETAIMSMVEGLSSRSPRRSFMMWSPTP